MNVTFNLSIIHDNVLQIQDTTQEYDEYLKEDNNNYFRLGRFKYSDTYTINVINYNGSKQYEQLEVIVTPHKDSNDVCFLDEAYYVLPKDGHYIIDHIILPSTHTIEYLIENSTIIDNYTGVYSTDGEKFYELVKVQSDDQTHYEFVECELMKILEINPTNTTISKSKQDTFSICYLNKQYLELNNKAFQNYKKCQEIKNLDIDLTWMVINAIKYNIECGFLRQAQTLLEEVMHCKTNNSQKNNGCKCCI